MDCTVIMPVGPGHQQLAQEALTSVFGASATPGPFEAVHLLVGDDIKGERGRSATRNAMVYGKTSWTMIFSMGDDQDKPYKSDWLFFLDADDLMCGPDIMGESAFSVVTPYVNDYDCIWGAIYELHPNGEVLRRNQTGRITTYEAYIKTPAVLGCQMGHFVRRDKFLGFDEELDVCEDIDLYLREWKELRCLKQELPLFLNRRGAHTWMHQEKGEGRPRHTGREWSQRANEMLKKAREEIDEKK